jgi:thioesterase domain-containing protein
MANEQLSTEEKADKVAAITVDSNQKLARQSGSEQLKDALSEKLAESHKAGRIDLDRLLDRTREHERPDRSEGRDR